MSFIRRLFFFNSRPDDFETVLSKLHDDIQRRTSLLSELRLRERRSTLLFTLYTLAIWSVYTVIWYLVLREGANWLQAVPVFVGPIAIMFVRRLVQIYYKRKGDAEERTLRSLRKTQREKLDEFKKKTNFNETRSLLEKYDDSQPSTPVSSVSAFNRRGPGPVPGGGSVMSPTPARNPGPSVIQQQQQQPKQRGIPPPIMTNGAGAPGTPLPAHLMGAPTPQPYTPGPKKWYDKVADAILGDDDDPRAGAAASRYALICEQCFKHNGLVKESMWEDTQYVCPKCGHFNASYRTKNSSNRSHAGRSASGSPPFGDNSPLSHRRPEPETPSQSRPSHQSQFNPNNRPQIPIIAVSSESHEGLRSISDEEDAGSVRPEKKKARSRRKGKKAETSADESMMDVDVEE